MSPVTGLGVLVAWSLLAVGGVYLWAAAPVVLGALVLGAMAPPRFGPTPSLRRLDRWLLVFLGAAALQLVPVPAGALARLSPERAAFQLRYALDTGLRQPASALPLSLDPATSAYTLVLAAASVLVFWSARRTLPRGGVRRLARLIGALGFLISILAILQHPLAGGRVYGFWEPTEPGAAPLGPAINRNQLAGWLLMALPLTLGYLAAHLQAHRPARTRRGWRARAAQTIDARVIWLGGAGVLMTLTLLFTASRAAFAGLLTAALVGWWIGRTRADARTRLAFIGLAIAALAAAQTWANLDVLAERLGQVGHPSTGRSVIWRETLELAGRFWLTGTGLGSYQTAMTVYQAAPRAVFFNHAHSQYLQLAAEGGLWLVTPALLAAGALLVSVRDALAADRSHIWSIRVGAVAALAAFAVQSLWECGLRMPANGVLLAVVAAIAVHRPAPEDPR